MKHSQWEKAGLAGIIFFTVGLTTSMQQALAQENTRFYCGQTHEEGSNTPVPATFFKNDDEKTPLIIWTEDRFPNPQQRCEKASPRFQEAKDNGTLELITNGTMNGQSVICTTQEYNGECDTLLMTLTSEDNSLQILNALKDQLNGRNVGPVKHSSTTPQVFVQVDLEELLRNK